MPDRKRTAILHIKDITAAFDKMIGAGHAGLTIDNMAFPQPLYVTWDGSWHKVGTRPGEIGASRSKWEKSNVGSLFSKLEAHRRIGFSDILDRNTGVVQANVLDALGSHGIQENSPHEFGAGSSVMPHTNYEIPCRAQISIGIPLKDTDNVFGLDVDAIHGWWFDILNMPPDDPRRMTGYKKLATMNSGGPTNCCGMVGRALQIGHLDAYADPPSNLFFQGSSSLVRWVKKATDRINKLNNGRRHILMNAEHAFAKSLILGNQQMDFNGECDLPNLEQWKKVSEVKAGITTGAARRKEQLLEIDNLIPQYHMARMMFKSMRGTFPDPVTANLNPANSLWQKNLIEIYEKTIEHLTFKPSSDRRGAMLSLMKTIERIMWGHAVYVQRINNPPADIDLYATIVSNGTWE